MTTDSLQAAAALAAKLGQSVEQILPSEPPVIDCGDLLADRIELRQVAGVSAGGSLELRPGSYDFGPVRRGPGRLDDGDPDVVGFSLELNGDMGAVISPGAGPVLVDDEPVIAPTEVSGRIINAGSARFVVARPRPLLKRDRRTVASAQAADPWALAPIPDGPATGLDPMGLVEQRRRLHDGPDEIRHRVECGRGFLFVRDPSHPLFGTAVVAIADVPIDGRTIAAPVPIAVDLFESDTVLVGPRSLQLAVARHVILSLAATTHPGDLTIELRSDRPELDFISRLPQSVDRRAGRAERSTGRRLIVVDQPDEPVAGRDGDDERDRTSILALAGPGPLPTGECDVLTVTDESTMMIHRGGQQLVRAATPIGFADSMAAELVEKLAMPS